ncbi:MAG: TolC family protein [Acidobacteriia bacterium]|nr:TolC family protein [Terriglobia bacterium]
MRVSAILLLAVPLCARLCAQQAMALTLADAERLAIQNNPQFAAARLSALASYQVPIEVRAGMMPTVSGAVTGVGADSGSRLAAGALNNPVVYNRLGTGLLVNQLVTDFGRTGSLIASAKLHAQAEDQVTETARADILVATARAYFAVLRGNAVLQVAQQTVSARQLVSDQITALFNSQLKSQLDVSFANVNLADAKLLLAQAQNDLRSSEAALAAAIGLSAQTSFSLSEEALPSALPDQVDPLIQQALQDRPELKDLRLEQSAAERFAKAEHALNYPTVGVAGTAGFVPAGETAVPGRYGAIGLNVNIPVFNGGLFRARQTEAELRAQAATEHVNDLTNRVTRDVRFAYFDARTAFERLGLTAQLLQQAELALDLARGRYDLGLSSIIELSQAQLNLTSAQIANTSAKYDYQTQRTVVDYEIGALR